MPINRSDYQIHIAATADASRIEKTKTGLEEVGQAATVAGNVTQSAATETTLAHGKTAESAADAGEKTKEAADKSAISQRGLNNAVQGAAQQFGNLTESFVLVEKLNERFSQLTEKAREATSAINEFCQAQERAAAAAEAANQAMERHITLLTTQMEQMNQVGNAQGNHQFPQVQAENQTAHEIGPTAGFDISQIVAQARMIESNMRAQWPQDRSKLDMAELLSIFERIIVLMEHQSGRVDSLQSSLQEFSRNLSNLESRCRNTFN